MAMDYGQVKKHWDNWAKEFGTSLRATTKSMTIKQLEIFALMRHLVPDKKISFRFYSIVNLVPLI